MFIPLHDANEFRHIRRAYVTIGIIIANVVIFLITVMGASEVFSDASILGLGYIPSVINDTVELQADFVIVPEDVTYFTYSFLHADLLHLGGNMLFLWVFGDNVEDAMGHVKYLLFYLLCAAAGAWLHGVILATSEMPLIGASGAIAGVVVAYLMLHPHIKLWVLVLMRIPLRIPAWIPIGLWIAFQFVMLFTQTEDQISWPAHVGGILAGAVLVPILKRRNVKLFDRLPAKPLTPPLVVPPDADVAPLESPVRWGRQ
jgi:membrane associated rhomboid family serine protease